MAYLKEWPTICDGCYRRATKQLFKETNEQVGKFCDACGRRALARLNLIEEKKKIEEEEKAWKRAGF